ncbi:MAG: YeeE/YedE family protein [Motiliproteus sp.]|nr:YeeE/YedE family protein [Motiliproteus sp.]MCW9053974.1 YeeE/YedE family protein [Motiliproteus sp.]
MGDFLVLPALAGGGLIGLSAALLLVANGRVAGISGIVGGLVSRQQDGNDFAWRLMFVVGIVCGGVLYQVLGGDVSTIQPLVNEPVLVLAGLLVGVGTTLGSGCTSGHGICGLARLSPRSLVATLSFMVAGAATATFIHGL